MCSTADRIDRLEAVDRICDAFEEEWRGGGVPRLEALLALAPPAWRDELLRELLPLELQWRRRRGLPIHADVIDRTQLAMQRIERPSELPDSETESRADGITTRVECGSASPASLLECWSPLMILGGCRIFEWLPLETLEAIAKASQLQHFSAGEYLLRQGDAGEALLIVEQGLVQIQLTEEPGRQRMLNTVGPGQVLGEMSLLTSEPVTADVVSLIPTHVLRFPAESFHALAAQDRHLSVVLTQLVATRLGGPDGDVLCGKCFDGFQIQRRLGAGGMSVVYDARRQSDGARVALKMMSHRLVYDSLALRYFQREADLIARFDHPHIVKHVGQIQAFHTHFLAMEFCDGEDLAAQLRRGVCFNQNEVRRILAGVASALDYAHSRGVIHRDIKPSNVVLTTSGCAKLMDFGLAKPVIEEEQLGKNALVGTPSYMAPELLAGEPASAQSDYFAFGCLAYELLMGHRLNGHASVPELREQSRSWTPPVVETSDIELAELVDCCLQREASCRRIDLGAVAAWA